MMASSATTTSTATATATATPVAMAATAVVASSIAPRTSPKKSVFLRLSYAAMVFVLQRLVLRPLLLVTDVKQKIWPPSLRPGQVKTYPCRPHLPIRIFFPESYDRKKPYPLPVLFTLHGGGFFIGRPKDTDEWNAEFSTMHGVLVIGLNYAKAPSNPFPGQPHDVAALLTAVLDDDADLAQHIDPSRVGLLGWSAGGNLALTAPMLPHIRGRITAGVVPVYPVVDFATRWPTKVAVRRYKPELGGFRGRNKDYLSDSHGLIDWSYVPAGQDLHDPLLSPIFAKPEWLPNRVFIVAVELDVLSQAAWRMACALGGKRAPRVDESVGQAAVQAKAVEEEGGQQGSRLVLDDERFHWEVSVGEGEDRRDYRWMLVPDTVHGFDMPIDIIARDETCMVDARIKRLQAMQVIGDWLFGSGGGGGGQQQS